MMEKIVRDRIPDIMRAANKVPRFRVAASAERHPLLLAKLYEECREFEQDRSVAELADILEVVYALAACLGATSEELHQIRHDKLAERGGFLEGYVLEI
ncbi:MAG: nucleoside triphosphate pyrophosphohydrolase [Sphingomonas sp.]